MGAILETLYIYLYNELACVLRNVRSATLIPLTLTPKNTQKGCPYDV